MTLYCHGQQYPFIFAPSLLILTYSVQRKHRDSISRGCSPKINYAVSRFEFQVQIALGTAVVRACNRDDIYSNGKVSFQTESRLAMAFNILQMRKPRVEHAR
jgi:hypothetical protein